MCGVDCYSLKYETWDVVTPSRKAASLESRNTIFAKLCGTRLSRSSYGVFAIITGYTWLLRGAHGNLPVSTTYGPVTATSTP